MGTETRWASLMVSKLINFILNSAISDKKKSFVLTVFLFFGVLFLLLSIQFWPPSNLTSIMGQGGGGSVSVSLGNSDWGSGNNYNISSDVSAQKAPNTLITDPIDEVISNTNPSDDVVALPNPSKKTTKSQTPKHETPVHEPKPKVATVTQDVLSNILKGGTNNGNGTDKLAGNKGKSSGSKGQNGHDGNGSGTGTGTGTGSGNGTGIGHGSGQGTGGGEGYSLGNRKALSKPTPKYQCNEEGKVVVEVTVDQNGNTIQATAGVKGTTNAAKCLLDQAKLAAMQTKWQASTSAPNKQVGKIVYNFSLN